MKHKGESCQWVMVKEKSDSESAAYYNRYSHGNSSAAAAAMLFYTTVTPTHALALLPLCSSSAIRALRPAPHKSLSDRSHPC